MLATGVGQVLKHLAFPPRYKPLGRSFSRLCAAFIFQFVFASLFGKYSRKAPGIDFRRIVGGFSSVFSIRVHFVLQKLETLIFTTSLRRKPHLLRFEASCFIIRSSICVNVFDEGCWERFGIDFGDDLGVILSGHGDKKLKKLFSKRELKNECIKSHAGRSGKHRETPTISPGRP